MKSTLLVLLVILMSRQTDSSNSSKKKVEVMKASLTMQTDPPLTPSSGGMSIDGRLLQVGDVIFSTTNKPLSWLIRLLSGEGPVSHVAIVSDKVGDLVFIIEAVGTGVRKVPIENFLIDNKIAVAFRYPNISAAQTNNFIAPYLNSRIGTQYDKFGAMSSISTLFRFNNKKVEVDYGQLNSQKTYCSKLMLEAYQSANIDLSQVTGNWSPNGLVTLSWTDILVYVGHLKYAP